MEHVSALTGGLGDARRVGEGWPWAGVCWRAGGACVRGPGVVGSQAFKLQECFHTMQGAV